MRAETTRETIALLVAYVVGMPLLMVITQFGRIPFNISSLSTPVLAVGFLKFPRLWQKVAIFLSFAGSYVGIIQLRYADDVTGWMLVFNTLQALLFVVLFRYVFRLPQNLQKMTARQIMLFMLVLIISSILGGLLKAVERRNLVINNDQPFYKRFFLWSSSDLLLFCSIPPFLLSFRPKHLVICRAQVRQKPCKAIIITVCIIILPAPIYLSRKLFISDFGLVSMLCLDFSLSLLISYLGGYLCGSFACLVTMKAVRLGYLVPYPAKSDVLYYERYLGISFFFILQPLTCFLFMRLIRERDRALKNTESEVEQRTRDLRKAQEMAEHLLQDKTNFMAFLCHELRNPLHAILNLAPTISENSNQTCEQRKETVDAITSFASHMMVLINDVLDMRKFEAGKVKLEKKNCDIRELFHEIVLPASTLMKSNGIDFKFTAASNVPEHVLLDEMRYKQVLSNLINNALKFTPAGGSVRILLDVNSSDPVPSLRTVVSDTGIGISEDEIGTLFKPYIQATANGGRQQGGTGLGLAICDMITKLMGGSLTVDSILAEGSTFTFSLPLELSVTREDCIVDMDEGAALLGTESTLSVSSNLIRTPNPQLDLTIEESPPEELVIEVHEQEQQPLRFLIVDDSEINRRILEKMLCHVVPESIISHAFDGQDAVNKVTGAETPFSVIFMDIVMPNLNGYEATMKIREANIDTVIIATTANSIVGDSERLFLDAGMNDALGKPFTQASIRSVLQKFNKL